MTRKVLRALRINGARGSAMFFFGIMSIVFGMAFNSPWKVIPPPPPGLSGLNSFLPLEVWAIGWFIAGIALVIGAFRQNQAWAMGAYASMLFVWFASYLSTAVYQVIDKGHTNMWFIVIIYGALLGAVISVARLVNAPPPKLDDDALHAVVTGELEVVVKKEPGDDS